MNIKYTGKTRLFIMFQIGMLLITGIFLVLKFWYPISWHWICAPLALSILSDGLFFMFYEFWTNVTEDHTENDNASN